MSEKLSPYEAFVRNIEDAKSLIRYANAFSNIRNRRMRQELRSRVGNALKVPVSQRDDMDCLESKGVFVVFKPGGGLTRNQFTDLQPLLRQSVVAACAALETYVADKAMEFVGNILRSGDLPTRMKSISLTIENWAEIQKYERHGWGIRRIIEGHIRELSSTAPNNIGFVLSTIGVKDWSVRVDVARNVGKGTTVKELQEITERRNLIAHAADKKARSKTQALAKLEEVEGQITIIEGVADAIENVLKQHS